jgi:two-component system, OmpR family, KDP operon response regulator KdpE
VPDQLPAAGEVLSGPASVALGSADARRWPTILVVDDDRELVDLLQFALRRAWLDPVAAYDGPTALRLFEERQPSLVTLGINLGDPEMNGLDVLKKLRQQSQVPVMMLTAWDWEEAKVRALEAGADDYITKPFSHLDLIAGIGAQLQRTGQKWAPRVSYMYEGSIRLDITRHSVTRAGQVVSLTATEFRLLQYLMTNPGRIVPTAELLKEVWGLQDPRASGVVRVYMHRLRRKVEQDPARPDLLHTIPGVGVLPFPAWDPVDIGRYRGKRALGPVSR